MFPNRTKGAPRKTTKARKAFLWLYNFIYRKILHSARASLEHFLLCNGWMKRALGHQQPELFTLHKFFINVKIISANICLPLSKREISICGDGWLSGELISNPYKCRSHVECADWHVNERTLEHELRCNDWEMLPSPPPLQTRNFINKSSAFNHHVTCQWARLSDG